MKRKFIESIEKVAREGYEKYGILPSLTISQSILESGWGKSHIGNNVFGIKKGSSWKGKTREVITTEYINGKKKTIKDEFRVYDSIEDSIRDYIELIGSLKRYKIVRESKNYKDACMNVLRAGYATDPNYAKKLIRIIEDNKLYEYDRGRDKSNLNKWGEKPWKWAVENKITDGRNPDKLATREEVITFLYRVKKLVE